jgi:hypothetical protein
MNHDEYPESYISEILRSVKTIAMIGASGRDVRPSNIVMKYLLDKGYTVTPVNPGLAGKDMLGQKVYASLADLPGPVDMVDVFRNSDALEGIVTEILQLDWKPKVLWAQLTVRNDEAARRAEAAGIKVVMNRCPKIEYGRHSREIGWNGVNSRIISSKKPIAQKGYQALGIRPQRDRTVR